MIDIYCDGGMLGRNPSPIGVYWSVGVAIPGNPFRTFREESRDHSTNNEAEWLALIAALTEVRRLVSSPCPRITVTIRSDSQLIVRQFSGRYRCKDERLAVLRARAWALTEELDPALTLNVTWVPRKEVVARLGH